MQSRYDRPRLIHKAHVRAILDNPTLKEGSGKELRHLHDTVQQHLRALKAMGSEAPGLFITSILELRLDHNALFEWHKHSHESAAVPHYNAILEFINLWAQASESLTTPSKKHIHSFKPITSYSTNADTSV